MNGLLAGNVPSFFFFFVFFFLSTSAILFTGFDGGDDDDYSIVVVAVQVVVVMVAVAVRFVTQLVRQVSSKGLLQLLFLSLLFLPAISRKPGQSSAAATSSSSAAGRIDSVWFYSPVSKSTVLRECMWVMWRHVISAKTHTDTKEHCCTCFVPRTHLSARLSVLMCTGQRFSVLCVCVCVLDWTAIGQPPCVPVTPTWTTSTTSDHNDCADDR